MYAGVYALIAAMVPLALLYPVSGTVVELLGLPAEFSAFSMAVPVPVIGASVRWWVVERGEAYSYLRSGAVGSVTALSTATFWLLVFGVSFVVAGGVLVTFVLAVVGPAGFVAGVPSTYVRRRQAGRLPER